MRRWVKVSKSGYYAWRNRPESSTTQRREDLTAIIVKFFDESEQAHGCRRVHAGPARGGVEASRSAWSARSWRQRVRLPVDPPGIRPGRIVPAPDPPGRPGRRPRGFAATAPGMRRVGGTAHGPARRGSAHPAVVMDCSPGRGRRARDRRSHARRTRRRGLGHGLSADPWCHGPPLGSGGSMHAGRMHEIHDRPRDPPVRRADRQLP